MCSGRERLIAISASRFDRLYSLTLGKISISSWGCRSMSARTRRAKKPFARVGQSITAVALVEEAALQVVFKRLDVARHRRVFRAEQRGCSRKRPR